MSRLSALSTITAMHMCVQTDKLGHQKYTAPQHTVFFIWSVFLLDKLSLKSGKVLSLPAGELAASFRQACSNLSRRSKPMTSWLYTKVANTRT